MAATVAVSAYRRARGFSPSSPDKTTGQANRLTSGTADNRSPDRTPVPRTRTGGHAVPSGPRPAIRPQKALESSSRAGPICSTVPSRVHFCGTGPSAVQSGTCRTDRTESINAATDRGLDLPVVRSRPEVPGGEAGQFTHVRGREGHGADLEERGRLTVP